MISKNKKDILFLFLSILSLSLIIRAIHFIQIGNILLETKGFERFTYNLYNSHMNYSFLMRLLRNSYHKDARFFHILGTLNINDFAILSSSLLLFEFNRKEQSNFKLKSYLLGLTIANALALFTISLGMLIPSDFMITLKVAGIVYLILAGVYIGLSVQQLLNFIRL